jgi:hypothetical protein
MRLSSWTGLHRDVRNSIGYSIGHIPIPILSLRLYRQILTNQAIVLVDTEDFEALKRYFNIKYLFLMQ